MPEFGLLLHALREAQHLTIEELSEKTGTETATGTTKWLSPQMIAAIENGSEFNGHQHEYLEAIAHALGFDERRKQELYLATGLSYEIIPAYLDASLVTQLPEHIPYPLAVYTPLGDILAFNAYFQELYSLSTEMLRELRYGEFGPNILRLYFEPIFDARKVFGGYDGWALHVKRMMKVLRATSLRYMVGARYQELFTGLRKKYPEFGRFWDEINNKDYDSRVLDVDPVVTIQHEKFGQMSFAKLAIPQDYLSREILFYGHLPTNLQSQENYLKLQKSVTENRAEFFGLESLEQILRDKVVVNGKDSAYTSTVLRENSNIKTNEEIEFADDLAKEAWEIRQQVNLLLASLPSEGDILDLKAIRFDEEHRRKGTHIIFMTGTVIPSGHKGIILVPERTRVALQRMDVPFEIIELDDVNNMAAR